MVYAIAHLSITNPDMLAQYREKAADALARHGGSVVQASGALSVLDGAPDLPDMVAVLSFPNADAANGWANDPDLAHIHALRQNAGRSDIVLLG